MPEDAANGEGVGDRRDAMAAAAAAWAAEDVLGEDALEELSPGAAAACSVAGIWGLASGCGARHDAIAERRCGGQATVVRPAVLAGVRNESGQALEECQEGTIDNISFTIVVGGVGYIYSCDEGGNPNEACGLVLVDEALRRIEFDNVSLHADSGEATGSLLVNGVLEW